MIQRPTYKRYTLSPEAQARHEERNRLQNERNKAETAKAREAVGLPPKPNISTKDQRKEQMKLYMRAKRAKEREQNAEQIAMDKQMRHAKRIADRDARREIAKINRAEKLKQERKTARLNGKPDKRTKSGRTKEHYTQAKVKMVQSKLAAAARPAYDRGAKIKPVKVQPKQIQTKAVPISDCTPVYIKELRATIYVKPGQDIEQVKARYLEKLAK